MTTATTPRDLLRIADLERGQLEYLIELAARMKAEPLGWRESHAGGLLGCYFSKPSTRTRVSLEAAGYRLGMLPVMLRPDELQLGRGEPIADTGRVLSRYLDAIAIRTFAQSDVEQLAEAADIPVVNALTDDHHPCQALADLLTVREHVGGLEGVKLAYIGDGNNVLHSLLEAGALVGMEVVAATPDDYRPNPEIVAAAEQTATGQGGSVELVAEPIEAVRGADVVYTDVWVSMGEDAERETRLAALASFQVTPELMESAAPGAIFMHCLPAHRGEEVSAEVIDGPRSVVIDQAGNRLPTEQALIHTLMTGDWTAH